MIAQWTDRWLLWHCNCQQSPHQHNSPRKDLPWGQWWDCHQEHLCGSAWFSLGHFCELGEGSHNDECMRSLHKHTLDECCFQHTVECPKLIDNWSFGRTAESPCAWKEVRQLGSCMGQHHWDPWRQLWKTQGEVATTWCVHWWDSEVECWGATKTSCHAKSHIGGHATSGEHVQFPDIVVQQMHPSERMHSMFYDSMLHIRMQGRVLNCTFKIA